MPTFHGCTAFVLVVWLAFDVTSRTSYCSSARRRDDQLYSPEFFDWVAAAEEVRQQTKSETSASKLSVAEAAAAAAAAAAFDESSLLPVKLQYLIAFDEEAMRTVREKQGTWPFADKAKCNRSETRDSGYYHKHHRDKGDEIIHLHRKYPRCGITRNSHLDSSSVDDEADEKAVDGNLKEIIKIGRSNYAAANEDFVKSHSARVIGGHTTRAGDWPWLAAVGRKAAGPKCGGSLIAEQWVLTAAHCFNEKEPLCQYNVRVGSRNWMHSEQNTHQDLGIAAIYRHPQYNTEDNSNDIALLKLSKPVKLDENSYINSVCLPKRSRSVKIGTKCVAAGWGKIEDDSKATVLDARQVELPVITYTDQCGAYRNGTMKEGMVCVGYLEGGRDTCQGDSGGPLVYQHRKQWTLLGITSFGEGCAKKRYPGIYTDVGHHIHWIASVVERYGD